MADPFSTIMAGIEKNRTPTADTGNAANNFAAVTREQWADYLNRFVPIEDQYIAAYQNPAQRQERIDAARGLSKTAYDVADQTAQQQGARYGLNMGANQDYHRRLGMNRAASMVEAANMTRAQLADRDRQMLSGGLTTKGVTQ